MILETEVETMKAYRSGLLAQEAQARIVLMRAGIPMDKQETSQFNRGSDESNEPCVHRTVTVSTNLACAPADPRDSS